MNNETINLKSIVWKEGSYFVARCLNVGVSSFGRTKKSALKNLKEALELYFENESIEIQKISNPEVVNTKLVSA
jgi:predicted RNase H-like HicB family nuclease